MTLPPPKKKNQPNKQTNKQQQKQWRGNQFSANFGPSYLSSAMVLVTVVLNTELELAPTGHQKLNFNLKGVRSLLFYDLLKLVDCEKVTFWKHKRNML